MSRLVEALGLLDADQEDDHRPLWQVEQTSSKRRQSIYFFVYNGHRRNHLKR